MTTKIESVKQYFYEVPRVEVLQAAVEKGFLNSDTPDSPASGDFGSGTEGVTPSSGNW